VTKACNAFGARERALTKAAMLPDVTALVAFAMTCPAASKQGVPTAHEVAEEERLKAAVARLAEHQELTVGGLVSVMDACITLGRKRLLTRADEAGGYEN